MRSMTLWLLGFLSMNVVLESLEVFAMFYESEESWGIISQLITEKIALSYFGIQFIMGSIIPLFILGTLAIVKFREQIRTHLGFLASALVLIGVFAMRWNVVIGGQLISKSLRGFTSYSPPLLGMEGIVVAAAFMILPLVITAVLFYLLPPWQEEVKPPERRGLALEGTAFNA